MPISSFDALRLTTCHLALHTKVALTAFRLSWDWHLQWPDEVPESVAAELADEADRCTDLREMRLEYADPAGETEVSPSEGLVRHTRIPVGV